MRPRPEQLYLICQPRPKLVKCGWAATTVVAVTARALAAGMMFLTAVTQCADCDEHRGSHDGQWLSQQLQWLQGESQQMSHCCEGRNGPLSPLATAAINLATAVTTIATAAAAIVTAFFTDIATFVTFTMKLLWP